MNKTALTLGSQIAIQGIGLITGILVARCLGPEGRGEVAAVMAWAAVITYLGDLGLPTAYAYSAAKEPQRRLQLFGNAVVATAVQWLTLLGIGVVIVEIALSHHGQALVRLATLYLCAYVPFNLLTRYIVSVQQGAGQFAGLNLVRLSVPASYLAFLVLAINVGSASVQGVLLANLSSFAFATVLAIGLAIRMVGRLGTVSAGRLVDMAALAHDLRYGIKAHLGTLQPFNSLQLDVLLITVLLTTQDVGLYIAALAGGAVLKAQGLAMGLVVLPEVAKQQDRDAQKAILGRAIRATLLLCGFTAAVAALWAEPLVRLVYGDSFAAAAPILRIVALGGLISALYRVIADGMRGMGYPLSGTVAEIVSVSIGVPLLLWLAPMGALGAAVAVTLASYGAFLTAVIALHRYGFEFSSLIIPRRRQALDIPTVRAVNRNAKEGEK